MELKTLIMVLSLMASVRCKDCQPSAEDLVNVLETEVSSYDQFIYGRYLASEDVTCQKASAGMNRLKTSFFEEMAVVLGPARRQLETVQATAKGTDAGPCVEQMLNILNRDLVEESSRFQQCLDIPAAQLEGLRKDLLRDMDKYAELKTRTKAALKSCLINLPSTCPNMTTPCMDTQMLSFNTNAKDLTETRLVRGPCMDTFVKALQCFSNSVQSYMRKARAVQRKTTACISFEDNNSTRQSILAFAKTLTANSTLLEQVKSAQRQFEELNADVVRMLGRYYKLEKSAKMTYEFSPHDKEFFKRRLDVVFSKLLRAVEQVRRNKRHVWPDNMADQCCDKALIYIRSTIDKVALDFERCESDILVKTLSNIQEVRTEFGQITKDLTRMGDATIMDCLNNGGVLTENAVKGCCDLQLRLFQMEKEDAQERVTMLMTSLEMYNRTYFNVAESTNLLCGHSFLKRTDWFMDKIMFQLSRCPYKGFTLDEQPAVTTITPTTTPTFTTTEYEVTDYPE